jgi:hypothetical protein
MTTSDTRAPDPSAQGATVATLVPLPGSVLSAATIVAAQGTLAATGAFLALWADHATRVHLLGRGIGAWRYGAAIMLGAFAVAAITGAFGLADRREWARPLAFAVEAAVMCGYLLTLAFNPLRALFGIAVAVGVLALMFSRRADAVFAPVESG